MKILVTGADQMLGKDIMSMLVKDPEVLGVKEGGLDLSDLERVQELCARYKPAVVIHTAAVTDVDYCEEKPWEAMRSNALGTHNLALACREVNAAMCYVSTDWVFSGSKKGPYTEWDVPDPINVYGHSRHAAESVVQNHLHKFFIIRTSELYGRHGDSFVLTLLSAAKEQTEIKVPNDVFALPSYSKDVAGVVARLAKSPFYGVYHVTNTWERNGLSMHDWATMILEEAGVKGVKLTPVASQSLDRPAKRPGRVILGNTFYRLRQQQPLRSCRDALQAFFKDVAKG